MCGRFALIADLEQIKQHFNLTKTSVVLVPRYNIAPSQPVVIINNPYADPKKYQINFANWGAKFLQPKMQIINAKLETILTKKLFSLAFKYQRCLIVASGFFEWKTIAERKIPFYVHIQQQPILGMAGILLNEQCVILTTQANKLGSKLDLGDRMPVIIDPQYYQDWLDLKTANELLVNDNLQLNQQQFCAYPVSTQTNKTSFDHPLCIRSLN